MRRIEVGEEACHRPHFSTARRAQTAGSSRPEEIPKTLGRARHGFYRLVLPAGLRSSSHNNAGGRWRGVGEPILRPPERSAGSPGHGAAGVGRTRGAICGVVRESVAEGRRRDCALKHSNSPYVENIFWGSGDGWTPGQAVTAWLLERKWYLQAGNRCISGQECGHYTQKMMEEDEDGGRRGSKTTPLHLARGDERRRALFRKVRMRGGRWEMSAGDEGGGARFVISNASALNAPTAVGLVRDSVLSFFIFLYSTAEMWTRKSCGVDYA
ncbi:hypothetical protein ACLOJK_038328 [Asimina triloba]